MSDDRDHVIEGVMDGIVREMTRSEFEATDPRSIARMSDKELAAWQSKYSTDSPQHIFAQHEWDRRLTVRQVRATRFAAWIGILGVILGAVVG
jgi:hypothetical protein